MALAAKYQHFLASPAEHLLAEGATISYIPTLTSVTEPAAIVRHLFAQTRLLNKKSEIVISQFESNDQLCAEIETTLEFNLGGGAYLPGLDDNFLADRVVTFPIVHIVSFAKDQTILHIRQHWDQGALLKAVDIIGSRAKNWPIRDSREQARLIAATSVKPSPGTSKSSSRRSTTSSAVSATNDPHKSLDLFQARELSDIEGPPRAKRPGIAPRTSAKPPNRGLEQILGGEELATSNAQRDRSPAKAGAGKNYRPNRLFDDDEDIDPRHSPEKNNIKTNPRKYSHFEFGNGEDALPIKTKQAIAPDGTEVKNRHQSQWDFEDFVTPHKMERKAHAQEQRHFGWSDDEDAETSPVVRPRVHLPRPDAKHHFEFTDETPVADRKQASIIGRTKQAMALYADPVFGGEEEDQDAKAKPLQTTTNVNNQARGKDFAAHYEISDDSPSLARKPEANGNGNGHAHPDEQHVRKKNQSHLDSHWGMYDESPSGHKENVPAGRTIKLGGDGMGGRSGGVRGWGIGDDSDEEGIRAHPTRRTGHQTEKSFWDF